MAGVALMLKATGATVQGSDTAFYPPMGPLLAQRGIMTLAGYHAEKHHAGPHISSGRQCLPARQPGGP